MAIQDGKFLNRLDVDRVFQVVCRIESDRLGAQITYKGKRLKERPEPAAVSAARAAEG